MSENLSAELLSVCFGVRLDIVGGFDIRLS